MKCTNKKIGKEELAKRMSKNSSFTISQSKQAIDTILDCIAEYLASNDFFQIRGFGSFSFKKYRRHVGRVPSGEIVEKQNPAYIKFKAGRNLRGAVKRKNVDKD